MPTAWECSARAGSSAGWWKTLRSGCWRQVINPTFRRISDFRKIHLKTLEGLFEQVLQIALEAGAMKVGRVALDGTKVKANASKHKAMSYDRMGEKQKQ